MKKLVVVLILVIIATVIANFFLKSQTRDGTEDTPEWRMQNLRVWKHTPVWALARAVKQQNTTKIEKLAKAHPEWLNYQEPRYGETLLIWAVGVEKYNSAEALLQCGANPNIATTCSGETALYVAAGHSWVEYQAKTDPKYIKLLLKYGADPNINYVGFKPTKDGSDMVESGRSPLMESISCGIEKTKALVEGGADINYKTASGNTAAIEALSWCGRNGTDEMREYAYYLIVEKKAKIVDPYYINKEVLMPGDDPNEKFYPVDMLREWTPILNSKEHTMKMKIVKEFARQGVDYWKTEIPDYPLEQIKNTYPDTWQEYIKQY